MHRRGAALGQAKSFDTWSSEVRTALSLIMAAEAQIVMFVGPDFLAFYNDAYTPTIGTKHPNALGNPARDSWSELWDDLEGLLRHVQSTGETIAERDRPFYIERFGYPETVYFDISFSPVRDSDGAVGAVLCIVSETTKRVEAVRALRENDSQMRAVVSGMAAGLCTLNHAGRIVTANQYFGDMLGSPLREIVGRNLRDLVDPRDWQDDWLDRRKVEAATSSAEVLYRRPDGGRIWLSQSISLLEDCREPDGWAFCLLTSDITERRRRETELRRMAAIIEGSDDAIFAMDLNMIVTSWNSGAERLYGWRADEIIGQSVLRLLPEGRQDEESAILARIRDGIRVEPYETTRIYRDGCEVPVSLTVSPIYDPVGEIIGASKIARDISAQLEANRMQEFLLFEMKHRVKNILATVLAMARQTFSRLDVPEYKVFSNRVLALARSQDLLTRKGHQSVEAKALIAEVLAPFRADQFHIEGPPFVVAGEAVLSVTLALHELVTNALKYGALSVAEGSVHIAWEISPGDPARVHLTWRESGGPPVAPPRRKGFGSILIRDLLASSLHADITLNYPESGVMFTADFPLPSCDQAGRSQPPESRAAPQGSKAKQMANEAKHRPATLASGGLIKPDPL